MNELKKAAIILLSLDKPNAARVMNHLSKDLMELVSLEIARTDDVTQSEQQEAISQFNEAVDSRTVIERGSLDLAGELLSQSVGEEEAEDILSFISEEQPQTIALIMSNLPTGLAADILKELPPDKQLDVVRRVASMEQTSPEFVEMVEASLKKRMGSLFGQQSDQVGGVPLVAQILNVADRATSKNILDTMGQESEELVDEIQRLMFVFDDISKLDDKSIQAVLKEVDNGQWAMALKGASPDIKGKILGNLSKRAGENLEEEMGYLGPVRVSDVERVQQEIVDTVRRLEEAGTITVASGEGDAFVS